MIDPKKTFRDGTMLVKRLSLVEILLTLWQMIFKASDPFDAKSWSNPVHFNYTGYDPSPFWDEDGKVYMTASHAWQILSV